MVRVKLRRQDGALLRLLGLVERREFRVENIRTRVLADDTWEVELEVSGTRDLTILHRQIARLVDVIEVA